MLNKFFCTFNMLTYVFCVSSLCSLLPEEEKIQEMYQEQFLEPGFLGNLINWGYWPLNFQDFRISEENRIEASKNLYRQVCEIAKITSADTVLELGCGKGVGAALIYEEVNPALLVGVDLNASFINFANTRYSKGNLFFANGNACKLSFLEDFSKVICVEASQHFLDLRGFLCSVYNSLIPQGSLTLAGMFAESAEGLVYLKNHIQTVSSNIDHIITISEFKNALEDYGFTNIVIVPIGEHVIPQYEAWLKQIGYSNIWAREWDTAFHEGNVNYFLINATKVD